MSLSNEFKVIATYLIDKKMTASGLEKALNKEGYSRNSIKRFIEPYKEYINHKSLLFTNKIFYELSLSALVDLYCKEISEGLNRTNAKLHEQYKQQIPKEKVKWQRNYLKKLDASTQEQIKFGINDKKLLIEIINKPAIKNIIINNNPGLDYAFYKIQLTFWELFSLTILPLPKTMSNEDFYNSYMGKFNSIDMQFNDNKINLLKAYPFEEFTQKEVIDWLVALKDIASKTEIATKRRIRDNRFNKSFTSEECIDFLTNKNLSQKQFDKFCKYLNNSSSILETRDNISNLIKKLQIPYCLPEPALDFNVLSLIN